MERKYFYINETAAKRSKEMMSYSDYKSNSTTMAYKSEIDAVYDIVDKVYESRGQELGDRAYALAVKYSSKMAQYYNKDNEIGTRCPSVIIAGPSNFPVRRKEKQVAAWEKNHEFYKQLQGYKDKINNILYCKEIIKSNDDTAIEQLEEKLQKCQGDQESMKRINAYYKKNKTLDACPDLSEENIQKLKASMEGSWRENPKPFESWALQNNNQNMKRIKDRIERLKAQKAAGDSEGEYEFFTYKENTEIMRIQIFFEEKPDVEVRSILKSHAFKWSPTNEAWQRQLTSNGKYALTQVIDELKKL